MAETYSNELDGILNVTTEPGVKAEGYAVGARGRVVRSTITLAAQADGDTIVLAQPEPGMVFSYGVLTTDTSLATATVSIGTVADPDAYRADAVATATDAPEVFATVAGLDSSTFDGTDQVKLTVGTAALPASGTVVIDLVFIGK